MSDPDSRDVPGVLGGTVRTAKLWSAEGALFLVLGCLREFWLWSKTTIVAIKVYVLRDLRKQVTL